MHWRLPRLHEKREKGGYGIEEKGAEEKRRDALGIDGVFMIGMKGKPNEESTG